MVLKSFPEFSVNESRVMINAISPKKIVQHIQKYPQMYIGSNELNAQYLVTELLTDAKLLGIKEAEYFSFANWHLIKAESNWIIKNTLGITLIEDIFNRIIPFPEAGVNSIRSEVIITAFASDVFVWYQESLTVIKGNKPNPELVDLLFLQPKFCIGFRM